ncbi:MAG: serine/threonine protein kinase [Mogibacterium sp.]|nr:serine/threonine protein kinase [Mogibacterium sp.]
MLNPGDTWNEWTVDSFLGEGQFGKVFKIVRRDSFGNVYESALKEMRIPESDVELETIRNEVQDEEGVYNYFRSKVEDIVSEFILMSELKGNSNIVSYEDHQVIQHPGEPVWDIFIRMELLTPLNKHVRKSSFTIKDVVKLGIDICSALELCQANHIIHRDIKPENIFYSETGNYKLGDFGIARELDATAAMTRVGTYSYMAPEISKGLAYNASVDIYSLGLVLYRFLNNNRLPFTPPYPEPVRHRDREEANRKRMRGEPMPPPCNASKELADVVLKACAYNPLYRYSNATEMRKALEMIDPDNANVVLQPKDEYSRTGSSAISASASASSSVSSSAFASDDEEKTVKEKPKKKIGKIILIFFLVLFLLAAAAGGAAFYFTDYYLTYFTPEYDNGPISEKDQANGFNGSWGYNEKKVKKLKYGDVTAYVPSNWRRYFLDMGIYGKEAEGRYAEIDDANGNRLAWFKIEYLGEFSSIKELRKSDTGKELFLKGKSKDIEGCDDAWAIKSFRNLDGETIKAIAVIVNGKAYWIGGGAIGDNYSVTNFNKLIDSCEYAQE